MFSIFKKSKPRDYDSLLADFTSFITKSEWDDVEQIKSLIQPAISLNYATGKAAKGQSKKGGTPDLPKSIAWPKYQSHSMVFMSQLNLAELRPYHRHDLLPQSGIIYFFSYFPEPENEFGAEFDYVREKEKTKTFYYDGDVSELSATHFPTDLITDYHFDEETLGFDTLFCLPPSNETVVMEQSTLTEADKERCSTFNENHSDIYGDTILGIPTPMQYGVDFDWALSYLGLDFEMYEGKKAEIDACGRKFVNFLALPLSDRIGDAQAYFGIHEDDLKDGNFDNTVLVMQGT